MFCCWFSVISLFKHQVYLETGRARCLQKQDKLPLGAGTNGRNLTARPDLIRGSGDSAIEST